MSAELDLTSELARLLNYTAEVATAIRMNSPYNGCYEPANPQHGNDVMWLADCLHNFGMLGRAIQGADPKGIDFACDMLLQAYERYGQDSYSDIVKGDPQGAFERNTELFSLAEGMRIFMDIKAKVSPLVRGVDDLLHETVQAVLGDPPEYPVEKCESASISRQSDNPPAFPAVKEPGAPGYFLQFSSARRHLRQR